MEAVEKWLKSNRNFSLVLFTIIILFGFTRLLQLTALPVFADEAIYIRWAQQIINQPKRNLFLPMYDGKPPLQMWIMTRFLTLTPLDPLFSARFMTTVFGLLSLAAMVLVVKELKGSRVAQIAVAALYLLLPFSLFYDRMALIDPLVTVWMGFSLWSLLKLKNSGRWYWTLLSGMFWGLALMSKTSALFFGPVIFLFAFWILLERGLKKGWKQFLMVGISGAIGLGLFYGLRVSPLFPFLFARSKDFTFTPLELFEGEWRAIFGNLKKFFRWHIWYLSAPALLLPLLSPLLYKKRLLSAPLILFFLGLVFAAPYLILGRVLSARYFLPIIVLWLPAAALALTKMFKKWPLMGTLFSLIILIHSLVFALPLYQDPNRALLPHEDRVQYLEAWSSGHGIKEVRNFIANKAQDKHVTVMTEGYFGTLPDGLLMYFDRSPLIKNLEIYGIGQPITGMPEEIDEKAARGPVYLVVNEDRWLVDTDTCCQLVAAYSRPSGAADLLLLKYTKE